jgi:hypothetical protein
VKVEENGEIYCENCYPEEGDWRELVDVMVRKISREMKRVGKQRMKEEEKEGEAIELIEKQLKSRRGIKAVIRSGDKLICRDWRGRLYEVVFNDLGGGDVMPMLRRISKEEVISDEKN